MTTFAPGTNPGYVNAYNNWWFGSNGRGPAPRRSDFGPDDPSGRDPGRAQPVLPPSRGTPYGQQPPMGQKAIPMPAYSQSAPPANGNLAYAPPSMRPPPFTQSTSFMGMPMDPSQYYGQRDAFINNINQARAPFALDPSSGRPSLDFGAMWGQAGDMVQGGWTNPFAAQPSQSPSQGAPSGAFGNIGTTLETHGWIGPNTFPGGTHPLDGDALPPPPRRQILRAHEDPLNPTGPNYGQPAAWSPRVPGYGSPPDQRAPRPMKDHMDRDGDMVDDRYQDGPGMPMYGRDQPPSPAAPPGRPNPRNDALGGTSGAVANGRYLLAPEVWTNPSDPVWLQRELRSKPDTRPMVYDERNRRYIPNPYQAQPIQPPDEGTPYGQPRQSPGEAFNAELARQRRQTQAAVRQGMITDVNGNITSPNGLPPAVRERYRRTGIWTR